MKLNETAKVVCFKNEMTPDDYVLRRWERGYEYLGIIEGDKSIIDVMVRNDLFWNWWRLACVKVEKEYLERCDEVDYEGFWSFAMRRKKLYNNYTKVGNKILRFKRVKSNIIS